LLQQNRRARIFLLALWLVFPALSSRADADSLPATIQNSSLSEGELKALHLAFRGFVAVTLPGGMHNGCEGHEASDFVRQHQEFYLAWYTVTIEAVCMGRPVQTAEVWFQCSHRNSITCTLSQPYEANPVNESETLKQN
jgi:hypothetical protein